MIFLLGMSSIHHFWLTATSPSYLLGTSAPWSASSKSFSNLFRQLAHCWLFSCAGWNPNVFDCRGAKSFLDWQHFLSMILKVQMFIQALPFVEHCRAKRLICYPAIIVAWCPLRVLYSVPGHHGGKFWVCIVFGTSRMHCRFFTQMIHLCPGKLRAIGLIMDHMYFK